MIFFIKNRVSERIPNYSLLLGAGCSITSDISTGVDLVEVWKKEYFNVAFYDEEYNEERLNQHLLNDCNWYKSDNEYSSLFEKIYHLPIQRRKFIQSQVDDKNPSIGYAYLVSLCEKNNKYFDTIYTTNFDDLINDSFYQFGQERPILCAHDSSIKSLSIHTERPKIIKLHGDYLYDSIKATNTETDSLNKNTESKFREFSKEFGLIVLGYAGNDSSIMNCINDLLSDEESDYFSNGIYWCVRKGGEISTKLDSLISNHDKVFFVEVEGFDEFMAKVSNSVRNDISILSKFNETKKEKIIANLVNDRFGLTRNEIIHKDISSLKKQNTQKDILEYIMSFNDDESINSNMSDAEFKDLLLVDTFIKDEKYEEAISRSVSLLKTDSSMDLKKKLYDRLISSYRKTDNEFEALRYCDELINIDIYDSEYYIRKAYLCKDRNKSINILMGCFDKFKNESHFLNTLSNFMLDDIKKEQKSEYKIENVREYIEKSIGISPSISNPAHKILFDIFDLDIEKDRSDKSKEDIRSKANEIILGFSKNKDNLAFYDLKLHSVVHENSVDYSKDVISSLIELRSRSKKKKQFNIEEKIANEVKKLHYKSGGDYKLYIEQLINSSELNDNKSAHLNFIKLHYYANVCQELNKLTELMDDIKSNYNVSEYADEIIEIYCDILNKPDDALTFIDTIKNEIPDYEFYKLRSDIYLCKNDITSSESDLEMAFQRGLPESSYNVFKSFLYLFFGRYQEAIDIIDNAKVNSDEVDILEINKQFAKKKLKLKVNENKLNEIISKCGKGYVKDKGSVLTDAKVICAKIILGKNMQYKGHVQSNIKHYPGLLNAYKKWPIIPNDILGKDILEVAS
ncbi:TPA: SIR2 family protein [Photobacterium damselae]